MTSQVVSKTGKSEGQDDGSKKSQEQQQTGKEGAHPQPEPQVFF